MTEEKVLTKEIAEQFFKNLLFCKLIRIWKY